MNARNPALKFLHFFFASFCAFPAGGRCLDVFEIALGQADEGKWYVSTPELQVASFQLGVACRGVRSLRVIVDRDMPLGLWGSEQNSDDFRKRAAKRRLPAPDAASVTWKLPADMLVSVLSTSNLLNRAKKLELRASNNQGWHTAVLSRGNCDTI